MLFIFIHCCFYVADTLVFGYSLLSVEHALPVFQSELI